MNRRRGALAFTRSAFLFCVVPLLDPGNGVYSGIAFRLSGDHANMANDMSYSTVSITHYGHKFLTDPAQRTKMFPRFTQYLMSTDNSIPNLLKTTALPFKFSHSNNTNQSPDSGLSFIINPTSSDDLRPLIQNISGFITNLYPLRIYLGTHNTIVHFHHTIFIYNLYNRFLCSIGYAQ